jgi:hypothetical protein
LYFCSSHPVRDLSKTMKLLDTLILSAAVALLIMGIYEVMATGLIFAYTFLMPSIVLFLWFTYRKRSKA